MRMPHTPTHWILVAIVLAALLLALNEAHGQSAGGAAAFEGRPALAGAQAGIGSQAGPPQGGIGVQGSEDAQRAVHLRRPAAVAENMPQGEPAAKGDAAKGDVAAARAAVRKERAVPRDPGVAREQHSVTRKARRAVKRSLRRSRTGVGEIDSQSGAGS